MKRRETATDAEAFYSKDFETISKTFSLRPSLARMRSSCARMADARAWARTCASE